MSVPRTTEYKKKRATHPSFVEHSHPLGNVSRSEQSSSETVWVGKVVAQPSAPSVQKFSVAIPGVSVPGNSPAQRAEYGSYRQFVERTIDVFGDELKASLWLSKPSPDLEGKVPLQIAELVQYAEAELDRIFEPIFIRIEHGIYS